MMFLSPRFRTRHAIRNGRVDRRLWLLDRLGLFTLSALIVALAVITTNST